MGGRSCGCMVWIGAGGCGCGCGSGQASMWVGTTVIVSSGWLRGSVAVNVRAEASDVKVVVDVDVGAVMGGHRWAWVLV